MQLSQDEFQVITEGKMLLNEDGELTPSHFEQMMLKQLKGYSHRKIQAALAAAEEDGMDSNIVFGLKIIMTTMDHLEQMQSLLTKDHQSQMQNNLKSRKDIINKLFRRPLTKAMEQWKEFHYLAEMEELEEDAKTEAGAAALGEDGRTWKDFFEAAEHHDMSAGEGGTQNVANSGMIMEQFSNMQARLDEIAGAVRGDAQATVQRPGEQGGRAGREKPMEKRLAALEGAVHSLAAGRTEIEDKLDRILLHLESSQGSGSWCFRPISQTFSKTKVEGLDESRRDARHGLSPQLPQSDSGRRRMTLVFSNDVVASHKGRGLAAGEQGEARQQLLEAPKRQQVTAEQQASLNPKS